MEFLYGLAMTEGNRKKPVYEIHKWWARRLGSCFRMLLLASITAAKDVRKLANGAFYEEHSERGLVVLDPFLGGGTSLVEAVKIGAKVVASDIDPVACLISRKEVEGVSLKSLEETFARIAAKCADRICARYRTSLPSGERGDVIYAFWVDVATCPDCGHTAEAHPHYRLALGRDGRRQTVFCARCGQIAEEPVSFHTFSCRGCGHRTEIAKGVTALGKFRCDECHKVTALTTLVAGGHPLARRLFALEVELRNGDSRIFKRADQGDRERYSAAAREFDRRASKLLVPMDFIPSRYRTDVRPLNHGFKTYSSLFNKRQLLSLAEIGESIACIEDPNIREFMAVAFSDCLAANNMFCAYAFGYRKLTPLFALHSYRKIVRPVENNVWGTTFGRGSFSKCFHKLLRGKRFALSPYEWLPKQGKARPIFTGEKAVARIVGSFRSLIRSRDRTAMLVNRSSDDMRHVPSKSVDLILTDPPYYDNIPYSELSDFYHVWLRRTAGRRYCGHGMVHTPMRSSLHPLTKPGTAAVDGGKAFRSKLRAVFRECRRVIKDSGLLVLTFHHSSLGAWQHLAVALMLNRFQITQVLPLRAEGRGGFHNCNGNLRWDAVICARPSKSPHPEHKNRHCPRSKALQTLATWQKRLTESGISLSAADQTSLARAFLLKEISATPPTERQVEAAIAVADPASRIPNVAKLGTTRRRRK